MKRIMTLALILMNLAGFAAAQNVTAKKGLTLEGARTAIVGAMAEARKRNTNGVIAVVDEGGNLMAVERIDNTFGAGANISIGKARTAALFKKPTRIFEELINKGRTAMTALNDFTPLIGGIPIVVDGQIVGGVGVSGASSANEDEELAIAGVKAVTDATSARVSYFPKDEVDRAFAKGAVLLSGDNRNYMVHASRREQPGQAEIHTKDVDVIHVLSGSATFVTGGTAVEPKTVAQDEIRGSSIEGGETRTLNPGDVIVVPAGTPHWFKEVSAPFTYYVVKVR